MKSALVTMAPAIDALTSACWPAASAVRTMTSSVRFPSVALIRPPAASPVFSATDSVARLSIAASGTIANTESTNSRVRASGRMISVTRAIGTNTRSHSSGVSLISLRSRVISTISRLVGPIDDAASEGQCRRQSRQPDGENQDRAEQRKDDVRDGIGHGKSVSASSDPLMALTLSSLYGRVLPRSFIIRRGGEITARTVELRARPARGQSARQSLGCRGAVPAPGYSGAATWR
jgi:hypothetical protein